MKKILLFALLIGCAAVFANENTVKNPSFEDGTASWGTLINAGKFNISVDSAVARTGKASGKLECTEINPKADGTWRQPKAWARWVQKVTVKPGAKYQFRCFARGKKGDNAKVTVFITGNEKPDVIGFTKELQGEQWIELKNDQSFTAKKETAIIYLNYYGEGTAWFDDVEMIEVK